MAALFVRMVWNGPFAAGHLQHPVTVGDALLKLFQVVWRLFLIIVLTGAVIAGYAVAYPSLFPPLEKQVTAVANYSIPGCGADHPLIVTFNNGSSKQIGRVEFRLEVREPGKATDLNETGQTYWNDNIIGAHLADSRCYSLPDVARAMPRPSDLSYATNVFSVTPYSGPDNPDLPQTTNNQPIAVVVTPPPAKPIK